MQNNNNNQGYHAAPSMSDDNSTVDTIVPGNGDGDTVRIGFGGSNNIITLDNGVHDKLDASLSHNDTIILGNGDGDTVSIVVPRSWKGATPGAPHSR